MKNDRGITLIALVITVIVLLILAGVAVSVGLNSGNIFERANEAKSSWNKDVEEENTILNGYLNSLETYEYGPITGTLDVGYDLISDSANTYKKIILSIDGLEDATEEQLLAQIAEKDGISVEEERAQLNQWAQEAANNGEDNYDTYEEQFADALSFFEIDSYEPRTATITFNGSNVPVYNNKFFLATQNGTYNVKIRSVSNKVGTVDIVIDGNNIGTTKEQSGINEEIFEIPASADFTDINSAHARIPTGYYVGKSSTINTIANGLVITSSIDTSGHSTGNEYVWIPVSDINNMIMCKSRTDSSECNIDFVGGVLKCTNNSHSATATQLCGRIYNPGVNYNNPTITNGNRIFQGAMATNKSGQTWNINSSHEPDIVSDYDKDDTTSGNNYMEQAGITDKTVATFSNQLINDFYEMAKSVATYKGFWIARYETGIAGGTKKGEIIADSYKNDTMWYGLYRLCRSIDNTNKVAKTMIWGSQYDQVVKFIGAQSEVGHTDRELNTLPYPAAYAPLDKMNNIFDLEGNLCEWISEACYKDSRSARGNAFRYIANKYFYPASDVDGSCKPTFANTRMGARAALYVTL